MPELLMEAAEFLEGGLIHGSAGWWDWRQSVVMEHPVSRSTTAGWLLLVVTEPSEDG